MDQEDENLSLLLNMGFPDVRAIKRALKLSNGDVNEAVMLLTEQPALTSYSTVDDLRDVHMADQPPPSYDQVSATLAECYLGPQADFWPVARRIVLGASYDNIIT